MANVHIWCRERDTAGILMDIVQVERLVSLPWMKLSQPTTKTQGYIRVIDAKMTAKSPNADRFSVNTHQQPIELTLSLRPGELSRIDTSATVGDVPPSFDMQIPPQFVMHALSTASVLRQHQAMLEGVSVNHIGVVLSVGCQFECGTRSSVMD
jgi:hypothetical protein